MLRSAFKLSLCWAELLNGIMLGSLSMWLPNGLYVGQRFQVVFMLGRDSQWHYVGQSFQVALTWAELPSGLYVGQCF